MATATETRRRKTPKTLDERLAEAAAASAVTEAAVAEAVKALDEARRADAMAKSAVLSILHQRAEIGREAEARRLSEIRDKHRAEELEKQLEPFDRAIKAARAEQTAQRKSGNDAAAAALGARIEQLTNQRADFAARK